MIKRESSVCYVLYMEMLKVMFYRNSIVGNICDKNLGV